VDDGSVLESKTHVLDLLTLEDRREGEEDLPARPGLDRAGKDLAVGHVVLSVRWKPAAPFHDEAQVGSGARDPQLAHALELARPGAERLGHGAPVRDRVVAFTCVAGAVDKILVLGQRHLGVLGVRLRRVERPAPGEVARADPLPAPVHHPVVRRELQAPPLGVNPRQRAGIDGSPERRPGIQLLGRDLLELGDVFELLLRCLLEGDLLEPRRRDLGIRVCAAPDRSRVERDGQRDRDVLAVDPVDLALLEVERVAGDQLGQLLDSRVSH
jgi:hypothetical protein